jgi:hypothetical protein
VFRLIPISDSGASRSSIPEHADLSPMTWDFTGTYLPGLNRRPSDRHGLESVIGLGWNH